MSDKEIHRIEGPISALGLGQIGVEATPDSDLTYRMYGGKDWAGGVHKFLDKDRPGSLETLRLIGPTTIGDIGLLRHASDGWVTGGPIELDDLNDMISDADLGPAFWARDAIDLYIYPIFAGDTLAVEDGSAVRPTYGFESSLGTGFYYDSGVGISYAGDAILRIDSEINSEQEYFVFRNERIGGGAVATSWLYNHCDGLGNMYLENVSESNSVYTIIRATASNGYSDLVLAADGDSYAKIAIDRSATDGSSIITVDSEISFYDIYTLGSSWTYSYGIPIAESIAEWNSIRTLLGGDGSLFAAIIAASTGGSPVSLQIAYDNGREIEVDSGSVRIYVPATASTVGLQVENLNSGNTSECVQIFNDATLSTGYAFYFDGDAGGDGTDYLEFGHLLWSPGSVTVGHGTGSGDEIRRSYTSYHYRFDGAVPWASAEMRAEADTGYGQYASVVCRAGNYGAVSANIDLETTGYVSIDSILAISIEAGGNITFDSDAGIRFSDGNRAGSSWGSAYMNFSTGTEWSDIETMAGSECTLLGAILAASSGGASLPDTEIAFGTGSGLSSSSNFTFASNLVTLNGKFVVNNVARGTATSATITSNTLTVNVNTGKDVQYANVTSGTGNVNNLALTAPTGGVANGIVIEIANSDTSPHTVGGGGTGWDSVEWERYGKNPGVDSIELEASGGACLLMLFYNGSQWRGSIAEFQGPGV